MSSDYFSAREIGDALGKPRPSINRALKSAPADGTKIASGNRACAWSFAAMPEPIRAELARISRARGYRSPLDVLRNPPTSWELSIPLAEIEPAEIAASQRLQAALARALALPADARMEAREELAATDYRREFRHVVSTRHLRRLIKRTLERDRGAGEFHRLEIYLTEAPRKQAPEPIARRKDFRFEEVDDALADVRDRTAATSTDRNHLFRAAFQALDRLREEGHAETTVKSALRAYLWKVAPFLARSPSALQCTFNLKLREHDAGKAIVDKRDRSGNRRRAPEWDYNFGLLKHWTLRYSGRESQAWRELHDGTNPTGERFTAAFRDYFTFEVRRAKSRVPATVRAALAPIVAAAMPNVHGPHAARLALPSALRDWSGVFAGDSFTSDDVTQNHYFYDWCDEGEYEFDGRRFNVLRGQLLPVIDERTDYPLGFSLIPRETYNGRDIRTLISRVCMDEGIGLPFVRFLFERGSGNPATSKPWSNGPRSPKPLPVPSRR